MKNEKKVLSHLKALCNSQLLKYSSSAEDDARQLQQPDSMPYNREICLRYRLGEKRLLQAAVDMVDAVVPLFDMQTKDVAMRVDHFPYSKYREYIMAVVVPLIDRQKLLDCLTS